MDVVWPLARLSLTDPRAAARAILALRVPREAHFTMFLLVCVLGAALSQAVVLLGPETDGPDAGFAPSGLMMVALLGAAIFVLTGIVAFAGRLFGVRADLRDALLLVIWLEGMMTVLQLGQLAAFLVAPGLAAAVSFALIAVFLWMLTGFTAELQGMDMAKAAAGLIGAALILSFVLAILIAILSAFGPG